MDILDIVNDAREREAKQKALDDEMAEYAEQQKKLNKKTTPFEFIESIQTKKYIMTERNESHFVPHIVIMGLSQFFQNTAFAFEATRLVTNTSGLPSKLANRMIYDYLYHTIREGKQFGKWAKVEKYEHLDLVIETYQVNRDDAIEIINRLTEDELNRLVEWNDNKAGGIARR